MPRAARPQPWRRLFAMAHLLPIADLLRRQPDFFTFDKSSLWLNEKPLYLGAYFDMQVIGGMMVKCHSSIGHWMFPARARLTGDQHADLLGKLERIFALRFRFAEAPPEVLDGRCLITMHVSGDASMRWWGIQQSARHALQVRENPLRHRANFHVSIDDTVWLAGPPPPPLRGAVPRAMLVAPPPPPHK